MDYDPRQHRDHWLEVHAESTLDIQDWLYRRVVLHSHCSPSGGAHTPWEPELHQDHLRSRSSPRRTCCQAHEQASRSCSGIEAPQARYCSQEFVESRCWIGVLPTCDHSTELRSIASSADRAMCLTQSALFQVNHELELTMLAHSLAVATS